MPNITFTTAEFDGPAEDIAKLHRLLKGADVSEVLLPIPPFAQGGHSWYGDPAKQAENEAIMAKAKKAFGYASDYDFVNDIWGSKWGITDIEFHSKELAPGATSFSVNWQSAWSPAYGLIYTLARLFPKVEVAVHSEDECSCYEPHDIVLKNPQGLVDSIVFGIDKKARGFMQSDGFIDIVNHRDDDDTYAYYREYTVSYPDADEEDEGDAQVDEGPRTKIPQYVGLVFVKAEHFLNGYLSGTATSIQMGPNLDVWKLWNEEK